MNHIERCKWSNLNNNENYIAYHDNEWGVPSHDDHHLFEMLVLESFHCGLSWLIILNKREHFRKAFDNFDAQKIALYGHEKIEELLMNPGIVRNKSKIVSTISNAKAYLKTKAEFGSFSNYIWSFSNHKIVYGDGLHFETTSELSDLVAKDLKKRGFKYVGSVTTQSYLQAIGVRNDHTQNCFKYHHKKAL